MEHTLPQRAPSEPIIIRTAKVAEIDALAGAMDRSRNYIVITPFRLYGLAGWCLGPATGSCPRTKPEVLTRVREAARALKEPRTAENLWTCCVRAAATSGKA